MNDEHYRNVLRQHGLAGAPDAQELLKACELIAMEAKWKAAENDLRILRERLDWWQRSLLRLFNDFEQRLPAETQASWYQNHRTNFYCLSAKGSDGV